MTLDGIVNLITSVGFPIAVCVYMFSERAKHDKTHKDETDGLREAINNNTLALQRLTDGLHLYKEE